MKNPSFNKTARIQAHMCQGCCQLPTFIQYVDVLNIA
jgi:hypothetical protein